jgi:hypothetical protein
MNMAIEKVKSKPGADFLAAITFRASESTGPSSASSCAFV